MNSHHLATRRIRVWDVPTRLSHWSIVILFGLCWWSAKSDHMHWHRIAGYGMLGMVVFRIAWGFIGGQTARFRDFVRGPRATVRYALKFIRNRTDASSAPLGHNPLGALSILVMLTLLLAQTVFGLFTVNLDGVASGPFAKWVSYDTGRMFAHLHAANFNLLLIMIALHLSAISFYRLARKESLIPAMIHGLKSRVSSDEVPYFVPWWRAITLAAGIMICIVLALHMA